MNESNTWVLLGSGQEEADKDERGKEKKRQGLCLIQSSPGYLGAVFWICQSAR